MLRRKKQKAKGESFGNGFHWGSSVMQLGYVVGKKGNIGGVGGLRASYGN